MAKRGNRSAYGEVIIDHKGKKIPTSVGSRAYESMFGGDRMQAVFARTDGHIPDGYHHRPELISNLFLSGPQGWWIICERNSIFDVFEQLKAGDSIRIPVRL